jgi:hypothetical protein
MSAVSLPAERRSAAPRPKPPSALQPALERPRTDWGTVILVNLVSLLLHGLILGVCAFIVLDHETREEIFTLLSVTPDVEHDAIFDLSPIQPDDLQPDQLTDDPLMVVSRDERVADQQAPFDLDIDDLEPSFVPEDFDAAGPNIKIGDHFSGRSAAAKAALVKKFGGNSASEAAVASGLKWLASRQLKDGSWSFDHTECQACSGGGCTQAGSMRNCRNGATALALLAFLGGGHTHQKGDYQKVVRSGLDALIRGGKMTEKGLDLRAASGEGSLYVHGLATIALCETAALTRDPRYSKPAFQAVKFTLAAQDPKGGGWRYSPNEPGDTSAVGWQIMALKSAQNGKIKVPGGAFKLADKFLDSVQGEKGATYGYMSSAATPPMTAVGLLCRMYMGWDKRNPILQKGVAYLDQTKPSPNNMYYNYYATQVLHHWGGEEWKRWNDVMRDHLIRTQVREGVETGSWDITDPHGGPGGRLYQTCLCVMTLEVYYRHLPIYQRDKLKAEF